MNRLLKIFTIFLLLPQTFCYADEDPFWETLNGPNGGVALDIAVNSKNQVFSAIVNGVYKSTDNGNSWVQMMDSNRVSNIIIDNDDNIFIIQHTKYLQSRWMHVLCSTDDGETWTNIDGPWYGQDYKFEPFDLALDYSGGLYVLSYRDNTVKNYEIYYTSNNGKTWEQKGDDFKMEIDGHYVMSMDILITDDYRIIIGGWGSYTGLGAIIVSTDGGLSWKEIIISEKINILKMSSDGLIYAGSQRGLYISKDDGETWEFKALEGLPINDILIPNENEIFLASYYGIFHSTDKGETWERILNGFEDLEITEIRTLAMGSDGTLYCTLWFKGVYRSTDNGANWEQTNNGIHGVTLLDFAFDQHGNIYSCSTGIYKSTDKGNSFEYLGMQKHVFSAIGVNRKGYIFAGGKGFRGIYISKDDGETWELKNEGYIGSVNTTDIFINKYDHVFVNHGGAVFRSTDDGETWDMISTGIANKAFAQNNAGNLFTVGELGEVAQSNDNGSTWVIVRERDDGYWRGSDKEDIVFHPYKPIGYIIGLNPGKYGLYKTTTNGSTWFNPEEELEFGISLAVDSLGNFWGGYYRTTDEGATWEVIDDGIKPGKIVYNIEVAPDGYIYLSTDYGGLYRSRDAFVSVETQDTKSHPLTISPNPSSETVEVSYYLSHPSWVKLKLFNSLGIEVATYDEEYRGEDYYSQIIDVSRLSPGMYFFQLETDYGVETKKMVVVR